MVAQQLVGARKRDVVTGLSPVQLVADGCAEISNGPTGLLVR